jgi:hypothetical protein
VPIGILPAQRFEPAIELRVASPHCLFCSVLSIDEGVDSRPELRTTLHYDLHAFLHQIPGGLELPVKLVRPLFSAVCPFFGAVHSLVGAVRSFFSAKLAFQNRLNCLFDIHGYLDYSSAAGRSSSQQAATAVGFRHPFGVFASLSSNCTD